MALLLTAALLVYLVLLADRAFALFESGTGLGIALGIGVLLLPVLGIWVVVVTWRNGLQIQRLSRRLDAEGTLPDVSGLPRRPSGRVDRAAGDAWFAERRAEVGADEGIWRARYRMRS